MSAPGLADQVEILTRGVMEPEGALVEASNTTLRCWASLDGVSVRCVYKPVAGERPLWDFPDGTLAGREVAAYLVAAYLGTLEPEWELVPPTITRDGPLGLGACQLWVEETGTPLVGFVPADALPDGWHRVAAAQDDAGRPYLLAHAEDPALARMAVFDMVVNNADRKGGHVVVGTTGGQTGSAGRLYGVDHGLCFHEDPKLRTVLWGWAGRPLPADAAPVLAALERAVAGALGESLAAQLSVAEVAALARRVGQARAAGRFATPSPAWPAVPWPPV